VTVVNQVVSKSREAVFTTAMSVRTPLLSTFLLPLLSRHPQRPFILGISGPQGAGKTTTVSTFAEHLRSEHNLSVAVLSVDDLYLTHSDQLALAQRHPENPLLSHRGEPGTHDISLGLETFAALRRNRDVIKFPVYDKSRFNGQGDRLSPEEWPSVTPPVDVLLFEGWCVGFRAIGKDAVARLREKRKALSRHALQSLLEVDTYLQSYDVLTE
jgi:D-glycerate 3-kinase